MVKREVSYGVTANPNVKPTAFFLDKEDAKKYMHYGENGKVYLVRLEEIYTVIESVEKLQGKRDTMDDIYKIVKCEAKRTGKTVSQVTAEILKREADNEEQEEASEVSGTDGE